MNKFCVPALLIGLLLAGGMFLATPVPTAAATPAADTYTYQYECWAHSLLNGDFGHHKIVVIATNDVEADIKAQNHLANWNLGKQHYNSKHAKRLSKVKN